MGGLICEDRMNPLFNEARMAEYEYELLVNLIYLVVPRFEIDCTMEDVHKLSELHMQREG